MTTSRDDTIVAVSSPPGRSLRGLLRLSGPECAAIVDRLQAPPACPLPVRQLIPIRLALAPGRSPLQRAGSPPSAALTFPALITRFQAPASYTGQDMAELQCPGNPALLDRLIHRCLALGARMAQPGEFTFRAFLAGKLDLTQAEGVWATVAATSDSELKAAALLRQGQLGRFAEQVVDELANSLALVEAGIDFTDQEDVVPIEPGALDDRLAALEAKLFDLTRHSRSWGALEALPRVVLAGPPSAGKSTLFNALLGRERAVISAMPGTTRDVLAEPLTLRRPDGQAVEIMLVDIAGLDHAQGALDRQVQAAARQAIERADLILAIRDGTAPDGGELPSEAAAAPSETPRLVVVTKADVAAGLAAGLARRSTSTTGDRGETARQGEPAMAHTARDSDNPMAPLRVSAHTGQGLDALRQRITQAVGERGVSVSGQMLALQPRHEAALRQALEHLAQARELLAPQRDEHGIAMVELVAGELRAGLDELASLGGQVTPDEVIGRIFATFCVGK